MATYRKGQAFGFRPVPGVQQREFGPVNLQAMEL
jgi:hypothetical protein